MTIGPSLRQAQTVPALALALALVALLSPALLAADIAVSGPGVLNQPGATYVLTQDVSAPGTAFVIAASGITLDLNGKTVTYNTAPSGSPVYGIVFGSSGQWVNSSSLRITNGTISQGNGNSPYSHAINFSIYGDPANTTISELDIRVRGDNCRAIVANWGERFNVHHNSITSDVSVITNRSAYDGYAIHMSSLRDSMIHDNTIVGGHGGIVLISSSDSSIYGNDISHRAVQTNGYGIMLWIPTNIEIYGNNVHTMFGCGIMVDNKYTNVSIYSNTVDVRMGWTPEYGDSLTAWGMKFRSEPGAGGNLKVHDNTIVSMTGDGLVKYAGGIGILDDVADLNNEYYNNNITVYTTSADKVAAGIRFPSDPSPAPDTGTKVYNNSITSNNINIDFSTSDGPGAGGIEFTGNTLVRGSNPLNYRTIDVGYWIYGSTGHVFLDTKAENGASVHDVGFSGSGGGDYSQYVKWYLDVTVTDEVGNPLEGAAVVAHSQSGTDTVVRVTDAQGVARLPLTEYYRYGTTSPATSNYDYSTPHTIGVSKSGYMDSSQAVTMNASKALAVSLSPGTGDPTDLLIQKTSDKTEAAPGEVVTYTIVFTNQTAAVLSPVVIIDPLPSEVTYIAGSTRLNGQVVTPDPYADGQIWVTVASLAAGGQGTITFQVSVE